MSVPSTYSEETKRKLLFYKFELDHTLVLQQLMRKDNKQKPNTDNEINEIEKNESSQFDESGYLNMDLSVSCS